MSAVTYWISRNNIYFEAILYSLRKLPHFFQGQVFAVIVVWFFWSSYYHMYRWLNIIQQWKSDKAMATHSSTLACKIPWTEEPGRLQSMGSLRVRHDWVTSLSLFTFMHWRRKWQPTPVFLPGESQGQRSLMGCCLWGRTVGHDWINSAAAAMKMNK